MECTIVVDGVHHYSGRSVLLHLMGFNTTVERFNTTVNAAMFFTVHCTNIHSMQYSKQYSKQAVNNTVNHSIYLYGHNSLSHCPLQEEYQVSATSEWYWIVGQCSAMNEALQWGVNSFVRLIFWFWGQNPWMLINVRKWGLNISNIFFCIEIINLNCLNMDRNEDKTKLRYIVRLLLLLSETQSSGFVPVCELAEIYARWWNGLPIRIIRAFFVLITKPTDFYEVVKIWRQYKIVWSCPYHKILC